MKRRLGRLVGVMLTGLLLFSGSVTAKAYDYEELGQYGRLYAFEDSEEQIDEEMRLGEMELIAQLVEAEAGNQDLEGKRLVVDVILNRLDDGRFGGSVEEIIFADHQFSVTKNGAFEKAAYNMKDSDYEAVRLEYGKARSERLDGDVLYFNCGDYVSGTYKLYKCGGHYFSK